MSKTIVAIGLILFVVLMAVGLMLTIAAPPPSDTTAARRLAICKEYNLQPVIEFYGDRTIVTGCAQRSPQ